MPLIRTEAGRRPATIDSPRSKCTSPVSVSVSICSTPTRATRASANAAKCEHSTTCLCVCARAHRIPPKHTHTPQKHITWLGVTYSRKAQLITSRPFLHTFNYMFKTYNCIIWAEHIFALFWNIPASLHLKSGIPGTSPTSTPLQSVWLNAVWSALMADDAITEIIGKETLNSLCLCVCVCNREQRARNSRRLPWERRQQCRWPHCACH